VLARLRAGVLPLEIETGRWRAIPADERFCKLCGNHEIEDESHFIFKCSIYSFDRASFFTKIEEEIPGFNSKTEVDKWNCLTSKEIVSRFARFVSEIFKKRQRIIYVN